jgi:hypothetical protein
MRASAAIMVLVTAPLVVLACGPNDSTTPPAAAPTATYAAYPPGYPPPGTPGYPTAYPPGYATAAPQYAPAPAPAPAYPTPYPAPAPAPVYTAQPAPTYAPAPAPAPAPATTGTMATPGLLALPCSSDTACGLHHCNTQYSKCAFPCQTAADCVGSNQCVMGVCVPGM